MNTTTDSTTFSNRLAQSLCPELSEHMVTVGP